MLARLRFVALQLGSMRSEQGTGMLHKALAIKLSSFATDVAPAWLVSRSPRTASRNTSAESAPGRKRMVAPPPTPPRAKGGKDRKGGKDKKKGSGGKGAAAASTQG